MGIDITKLEKFTFMGQERFRCPDCPFDHYEPAIVLDHHRTVHGSVKTEYTPTLFDYEGKELNRRDQD